MKKYIIAIATVVTIMFTTGCNDFLDKPDLNTVTDNNSFWRNESDFRMYAQEFYEWFFTGYNSYWGTDYTPLLGYTFNDDMVTSGKQENFVSSIPGNMGVQSTPSNLLNQSWYRQYNGERWNFGWVRKANIMLKRCDDYKANLSDAEYKHWTAVARFFRAYAYYNLVITFGDVPYFDKPVDEKDVATMYKDRDSRGDVMDHVYDDLKYAIDNAKTIDNNSAKQQVNKYIISAIASRIMLFEGTWEKYHNLSAERAKKYLQLCVDASQVVMNSGAYSCTSDFRSLFGSDDLSNNPEVIMFRHYETSLVTHCIGSYSNGEEGQGPAVNLQLIKSFICNDGKTYQNSTLPNANNFDLAELAKTRDPRFEATFYNLPLKSSQSLIYADKFISRVGASYYDPKNYASRPDIYGSDININDAPVLRYAEVLLNWIEAKEELAESYNGTPVTQGDIDISINALRDRPLDQTAIANGVKKTEHLNLNNLPNDPNRDSDVSPLLWEIRRERRMEFVFENTRLLDIKRWGKIEYMDNNKYPDTMYGTWVDFPNELKNFLDNAHIGLLTVRNAAGEDVVYNGTNASAMVGFYKPDKMQPRDQFDYAKAYVMAVGTTQIQDYKDHGYTLTQTDAWK